MNETLAQLLNDCAAAPGALGCVVRLSDHANHVASYHQACPAENLERTMSHLINALAMLTAHELTVQRLSWTFSAGRIFLATRPDGGLFILITLNDAHAAEFFDRMALQFYLV